MYDLELIRPTPIRELARVGDQNDGGYVIPELSLAMTDTLLSLGLAFNWSFDDQFLAASHAAVIGVDGSLTRWDFTRRALQKWRHGLGYLLSGKIAKARERSARAQDLMRWRDIFFGASGGPSSRMLKLYVGTLPGSEFITIGGLLGDAPRKNASVFVKMDIEGSEYEVLHELRDRAAEINAFVVEFHGLGPRGAEFTTCIRALLERFTIVHVHPNNLGGVIPGTDLPDTLEITFLNSALLPRTTTRAAMPAYPIAGLDAACSPRIPELPLNFRRS